MAKRTRDKFLLAENPIKDTCEGLFILHTAFPKMLIETATDIENPDIVSSGHPHFMGSYINSDRLYETRALVIRDVYEGCTVAEQQQLLREAWTWFVRYLKWEDRNIYESDIAKLNQHESERYYNKRKKK